jgi:hypothetical protein
MSILKTARIGQKALAPLVILALVATTAFLLVLSRFAAFDAEYSLMVDKEAPAATWLARANSARNQVVALTYEVVAETDPALMAGLQDEFGTYK